MDAWFLAGLCTLFFAGGWFVNELLRTSRFLSQKNEFNQTDEIKHRLQLLFDNYSDESIEAFIQKLEVSSSTLAMHISIGKQFRSQGEVEKAILVHQNVMTHPELSAKESELIIYELAKDYKAAGLFDRAESLLVQLKSSKLLAIKSVSLLLDIHEAEKDWQAALKEVAQVDFKKEPEIAMRVAHYYCELADKQQKEGFHEDVKVTYRKALSVNKECYRAILGLSKLALKESQFTQAISYLKEFISVAPEQASLALPMLLEATKGSESFQGHQQYLKQLLEQTGQITFVYAIVESMLAEDDIRKARYFLFTYLQDHPNLYVLNKLFSLKDDNQFSSCNLLELVKYVLAHHKLEKTEYKCSSCGFSCGSSHWHCPSCKTWQSIKPVIQYETLKSIDK